MVNVSLPATPTPSPASPQPYVSANETFSVLEKLADLHGKGILTDAEYEPKKPKS